MRPSCSGKVALLSATRQRCGPLAAVRPFTSNFGKTRASAAQLDEEPAAGGADAESGLPTSSSSDSPAPPPPRYRRRTSDPQTPRERAVFRRDHKYSKHRPLPDAPWRQLKTRTYLDDAERLHGRKETWHAVEDAALREKLVAILQDYLRDTLAAARLEAKDARKFAILCSTAARHYRAHVSSAAFGMPDGLQGWARRTVADGAVEPASPAPLDGLSTSADAEAATSLGERAGAPDATAPMAVARGDDDFSTASSPSPPSSAAERAAAQMREERRRRGAEADLSHTVALSDLPPTDGRHPPQSAFPFLRQRAVEHGATLDPSLVDWTAKYFPDDDAATFAEPPRLRTSMMADSAEGAALDASGAGASGSDGDGATPLAAHGVAGSRRPSGFAPPSSPVLHRPAALHARHRLQRSLRDHENRHRATFDAEGIYYKVRRQSEVDDRAPKPQQVKASDLDTPGRRPEVVKVPWAVAARAKAQGYSSDTLRAKERLIRLTRGEDPETIP
ncbi:hypothetical protein NESM_000158400 [Novymonas esmeraldas]|uniref:54S ribosomal protein L4, mitochondrial n=1 Tax=Novymonas esmeraldas TaxID=1808958 RepID=A0AAW0F6R8_9TRYP